MVAARGGPTLSPSREVHMGEEKVPASFMHKCAVCGRVAAVLSLLLLVPAIRKRRAQKHAHAKRFPIFGH